MAGHVVANGGLGAPGVIFHLASGIDSDCVAQAQSPLRRCILRAFFGWGLLEPFEANDMLDYLLSGFSVDVGVCIEVHDRSAPERLLFYCSRPPFAMDCLRKAGNVLVYRCAIQYSELMSDHLGARADELQLTPLERMACIAALVPPSRRHRHRYFGELAPNSPIRPVAGAMAASAQPATTLAEPELMPPKRAKAQFLWAVLIACIYEIFSLLCPLSGGQMLHHTVPPLGKYLDISD